MAPLHVAIGNKAYGAVKLLLKAGADIKATNEVRRERKEVGGERGRGLQGACMSGCVKGRQWRQVREAKKFVFSWTEATAAVCVSSLECTNLSRRYRDGFKHFSMRT